MDQLHDRIAIGTAEFVASIKRDRTFTSREVTKKRAMRERVSFEQIVKAVEDVRAESWTDLSNRWGDPSKWPALSLARQYTGMTLAELGAKIGGKDYSAIGVGLRRFEAKLSRDKSLRRFKEQVRRNVIC